MTEKKAKKSDKGKKKDAAKEIKRLRKDVKELTETVSHLYRDLDRAIGQISELHVRWGSGSIKVVPGDALIGERRFSVEDGIPTIPGHPANLMPNPAAESSSDGWSVPQTFGGVIGWDAVEGRPVQVRDIVMGSERPPNEYTFWFTEEMCEKLGIPDTQRHLVETGREGRLTMVDGPPVDLSPEHRELVRNVVGEGADAETLVRERDAIHEQEGKEA